ncbi:hypothetical protein M9Y10_036838 [Tritrichomonas musculus]|uniref:Myb-like DNA-binding domain containing protein n=1 Tax=Tritrichomonas musculus TaxID=1915356 RepID=A0ABR2GTX7_9EUKA
MNMHQVDNSQQERDNSFDDISNFIIDEEDEKTDEIKKRRKRRPFSKKEDQLLLELVQKYGEEDKWKKIASQMKGRNCRQCRERYKLFLCKNVHKKIKWTKQDDELLLAKYQILGPRWKKMEKYFKGLTYVTIRNRFMSLTRKNTQLQYKIKYKPKISDNPPTFLPNICNQPIETIEKNDDSLPNLFKENDEFKIDDVFDLWQ